MSYAIIRNENHKMGAVHLIERHNERLNKNYSNKDIDLSRSHLNYHLKKIQSETYHQEFERIRSQYNLLGNLRLTGEKQSNVMCEFLITSDKEFFDRLGEEKTKRFFSDAYDFVASKVGGEQFIVSAVVHIDEKSPHMHVSYIPVIKGKDRKKNPCLRINCSEFWKGRDSYSKLQDEYFDYITSRGYPLERGERGSTAEHLSVSEYKLKKTIEQISELTEQVAEIESVDNISKRNLPLNMVALKKTDFETLTAAAKGYVSAKKAEAENAVLNEKCITLEAKNHELTEENNILSGNLKQLEMDFDNFADSVQSETELQEENCKLSKEIDIKSFQCNTLEKEKAEIIEENTQLKDDAEDSKEQIRSLNENLTAVQSALKALQEKYDKVLKFIEKMQLKEKLEEFLKPVIQKHKSR